MELEDGYGAFEIKLGMDSIEEAKNNLIKYNKNVTKKPTFMCIIVGLIDHIT